MKFLHILQSLWCEPWLIKPEMHRTLCDIVESHYNGDAHKEGGIASAFADEQDDGAPKMDIIDSMAIIPIHGVIGKNVHPIVKSSGVVDVEDITRLIHQALDNPTIRGILYDVNSPGGSITGTPELAELVRDATKIKHSVAFTDQLMASAAYWISAGTDAIYASPSSNVGSIGVYMAWLDSSRWMEDNGLKTELIKHGKFKAIGLSGTELNAEQRAHLQVQVDEIFNWFSGWVTEFRDIPDEAMEGQVFMGKDAINSNLIDAVGSVDDALNELKDLANSQV